MKKYYTRACNFFYGSESKKLIKKRLSLPLCGEKSISFNQVEIFIKEKKKIDSKIIDIKDINKLPVSIKKKILKDLDNEHSICYYLSKKNRNILEMVGYSSQLLRRHIQKHSTFL